MQSKIELEKSSVNLQRDLFPLLILFLGIAAISLTPLFLKVSVREISVTSTLFNRLWIASIVLFLLNSISQFIQSQFSQAELPKAETNQPYKWENLLVLVAMVVCHLLGRFLWTFSLTKTSIASATILTCFSPIFTALGGWLFLNQKFDRRFIVGLTIASIGGMTLGLDDFLASSHSNLIGDLAATISCIFYAASLLILDKIRKSLSSLNILLVRCSISTLLISPFVFFLEDPIFPISRWGWLSVICIAVVCEAFGHGVVVYSVNKFSSSFVSICFLLEPALTIVFSWLILADSLSLFNVLALGIVSQGLYWAKTGKGAEQEI
jgi:drug/metabolite transporter (DMT)-like permease